MLLFIYEIFFRGGYPPLLSGFYLNLRQFQPNFTDMSLRENVTARLTMQAGMNDIMP